MKINISNNVGIVLLRHVKNEEQNKLWQLCYKCIRKYYPITKIMIIDDNSNTQYIQGQHELTNTIIIKSEYKGRGEILPYYYMFKTQIFDKALIIHDSCFIQKYIDIDNIKTNIQFLWYVEHCYDEVLAGYVHDPTMNRPLIKYLNNSDKLLDYYEKKDEKKPPWYGCFGLMSITKLSFINKLQEKYNLFNTMNYIKVRRNRAEMERVFGLLCCYEEDFINKNISFALNGNIHAYLQQNDLWKYCHQNGIENFQKDYNNINFKFNDNVNIIKSIGCGR